MDADRCCDQMTSWVSVAIGVSVLFISKCNFILTQTMLFVFQVNGAVVLVVDDHANVKGDFTTHFPFHLLKKVVSKISIFFKMMAT